MIDTLIAVVIGASLMTCVEIMMQICKIQTPVTGPSHTVPASHDDEDKGDTKCFVLSWLPKAYAESPMGVHVRFALENSESLDWICGDLVMAVRSEFEVAQAGPLFHFPRYSILLLSCFVSCYAVQATSEMLALCPRHND